MNNMPIIGMQFFSRRLRVKSIYLTFIAIFWLLVYVSLNVMMSSDRRSNNAKRSRMETSRANGTKHLKFRNYMQLHVHNTNEKDRSLSTNHPLSLTIETIISEQNSVYLKQNNDTVRGYNQINTQNAKIRNKSEIASPFKPNKLEHQADGKAGTLRQKVTTVNKNMNYIKANVRQSSCSSCFQHNFQYVMQNERICQLYSPNQTIELLVLITTTHNNFEARAALRSTWLSYTKHNRGNLRYAFLLGETNDDRQIKAVVDENSIHHDIIKEDFVDTYLNLTYKTIMGFKWASDYCRHALYVLKTDDDMYVNIPNLLKMLNSTYIGKLQTTVIGACLSDERPIRDKNSKWFASENSYPDEFYPLFCSGTGYVTSIHVAKEVYLISPNIPFFHLEDVYVSLCIKKLGFGVRSVPGFKTDPDIIDGCVYNADELITSHHITPKMMQILWKNHCVRKHLYVLFFQIAMICGVLTFIFGLVYSRTRI